MNSTITGKWNRPSLCLPRFRFWGFHQLSIFFSSSFFTISFHPYLHSCIWIPQNSPQGKWDQLNWPIVFWNGENTFVHSTLIRWWCKELENGAWAAEYGWATGNFRCQYFSSDSLSFWLSHSPWLIVPMKTRNCIAMHTKQVAEIGWVRLDRWTKQVEIR